MAEETRKTEQVSSITVGRAGPSDGPTRTVGTTAESRATRGLEAPPPASAPGPVAARPTGNGAQANPSNAGNTLARAAVEQARGGQDLDRVALALEEAGLGTLQGRQPWQAAGQLAENPRFREVGGLAPAQLRDLPAGQVVVWDRSQGDPRGHIAVTTGDGREASDRVRPLMTGYGSDYRVFSPQDQPGQSVTPTNPVARVAKTAPVSSPARPVEPGKRDWEGVKSWAFRLQGAPPETWKNVNLDMLVVDQSSQDGVATREGVERIRKNPDGSQRKVVNYLSVGEAENYRPYWKEHQLDERKPSWLLSENKDWGGDHLVKYWDKEWQGILDKRLEQIVKSGADGIYLDKVDSYKDLERMGVKDARKRMVDLVEHLRTRATELGAGKDFGIFMQNSEELITDPRIQKAATGFGVEEPTYGWGNQDGARRPPASRAEMDGYLQKARSLGKKVFTIDYPKPGKLAAAQAREAYEWSRGRGYVPTVAPRMLDSYMRIDGVQ